MLDVLILGGGVAGLALGWYLQPSSTRFAVREARTRWGGRTHSLELDGHRFDLGASWVWGHEQSVIGLLDTLECATFAAWEDGDDLFEPQTGPVRQGRLPRAWSPTYRLSGGTQSIADALRARLDAADLQLSRVAQSIETNGDGLQVTYTDGRTERARHVVAAYPPPLVAPQVSALDPERRKILSATPIWMGDIAKVVAVFDRPFWRTKGMSGRALSHVGPMVEIHDLSPTPTRSAEEGPGALFGFVPRQGVAAGGPRPDQWTEAELERAVHAQLRRLFPDAPTPAHTITARWWTEPETVPSTLAAPNHELFGHAVLREPLLGGRLHLASTETAPQNTGHIDGAVQRAHALAQMLRTP